jgi:pimeloyl-ACP methyl ester carboxylesterase
MWVNNGHTEPGTGGNLDKDLSTWGNPPANPPNCTYGAIRCQRNLENFARLWVCGMPALPLNQGYNVTLSMFPQSGNPAINLYWSCETNGGIGYLTNTNIAAQQIAINAVSTYGASVGTVSNNQSYTFPDGTFVFGGTQYLLFEGAGIGFGQLTLTISQGTNILAQTSAWLDLHDVADLFERAHIEGITNVLPGNPFSASTYVEDNTLPPSLTEDTNLVLFVHGWRMGEWDYEDFSETMFKRLYWQGYHGRFMSLRWPTLSKDDYNNLPEVVSDFLSRTTYNRSEFIAWRSAAGLSAYLTNLKQRFPNYSLNVCAHSMGNVVMAEALKLQLAASQQNVNNYVLMQGAVPASCYDTTFTNYAPFLAAEQSEPTPNTYWGYPGAINQAVSGNLVDFFNTNDFALVTGTLGGINVSWEANQELFKPDTILGYRTDGINCANGFNVISDPREIMSFCARPRSRAVGAQPGVGGQVYAPAQVDLRANFGFDNKAEQHSAEFNWPVQTTAAFYYTLLHSLIPPN